MRHLIVKNIIECGILRYVQLFNAILFSIASFLVMVAHVSETFFIISKRRSRDA